MALISPGVQVTVIDESQYQPTAAGTIAYVILATEQDKLNPSGTTATYTTAANADKVLKITSQRELVSYYGVPKFQLDSTGTPLHANELNEYGLLAAYSALGVANQLYIQRADVDLASLTGTSIRPTSTPNDGTYWLDLGNTNWGIYEWTEDGFTLQTPLVITSASDVSGTVPLTSIGSIGDYAVVARSTSNPVYYKGPDNSWNLVGSSAWKGTVPTIQGSTPTALTIGDSFTLNGVNVSVLLGGTGSAVMSNVATRINTLLLGQGVTANVNVAGQLIVYANALAKSDGTTVDGKVKITPATTAPDAATKLGLLQADNATISGSSYIYNGPTVAFASYRDVPAWSPSDDPNTRPFGSVWFKTSSTGNGASWAIKEYSASTASWLTPTANLYESDAAAIANLDSSAGGAGLASGTIYVKYDSAGTTTGQFKLYIKDVTGILKVTGDTTAGTFVANTASFNMNVTAPGGTYYDATITASGNLTASGTVAAILSLGLPNISAVVESSGAISITHQAGGVIKFTELSGTPVVSMGLDADEHVQSLGNGVYLASPFLPMESGTVPYTYSSTEPYNNPADGQLWYYNNPLEVDIMIQSGTGWKGYLNLGSGVTDARGYDLSLTDAGGPILSTTEPTVQSDGTSSVVAGDLWIDTGDLENYPVIRRYNGTAWELIDNTDQVSADGILFADARWSSTGNVNPVTDDLPTITSLLASNYIDPDAPDYRLYARGTILFNTRRSGYNVKRFESAQFTSADAAPATVLGTWVSSSGNDVDGVPYFGHKAQRNVVVEAMKSAIESSTALREEQVQFNLMCCPGYPELIGNMITLNNDRKNTAFIIGDSPLTLNSASATIEAWASNQNLAADNGTDGLVSTSEYLGVYYPSGYATNLDGESVVVPASHMMLRTFIRSDNVSYPWFAPAGVRRGLIDNVSAIGFVDTTDSNTFKSIGVTEGLRDVLYTQRVNPLTVLPGVGLVAYGQKTRAATTSAMDRVNVARLVCYLRTVLDSVARPFVFEPNDTITRNQVKASFEQVLNDLVAKRGIYDYLVVCDTTNNTPDRIDRNELWVDIAIEPVKAIEFIYIPVRLKNTGAIAAGL